MDRIKPIELEKSRIPRAWRGLDPNIVHILLDRSSRELEELLMEQRQLRGENDRLLAEVNKTREMESSLRDAILIAQRAADETRSNAHKEADLIIESAKQKAFEEQHELAKEVDSLLTEIEVLKKERERFIRQFRILLNDHVKELNQLEGYQNAVIVVQEPEPESTLEPTPEPTPEPEVQQELAVSVE